MLCHTNINITTKYFPAARIRVSSRYIICTYHYVVLSLFRRIRIRLVSVSRHNCLKRTTKIEVVIMSDPMFVFSLVEITNMQLFTRAPYCMVSCMSQRIEFVPNNRMQPRRLKKLAVVGGLDADSTGLLLFSQVRESLSHLSATIAFQTIAWRNVIRANACDISYVCAGRSVGAPCH